MAGFKTHITASGLLGVGYGFAGHLWFDAPLATSVLAGGLCGIAGMLPDLDSESGRPVKESLAFAAAVIPMMLSDRFREFGLTTESIVLVTGLMYVIIRFGLGEVFTRMTVHRGMFHSFPAALIVGELAFLVSTGSLEIRLYKAGAIVAGYICHLVLDEMYSFEMYRGRLRLKKSFGTALKFFGHDWMGNLAVYACLALITMIAVEEPGWMAQYRSNQEQLQAENHQPGGHLEGVENEVYKASRDALDTVRDTTENWFR